MQKTPSDNQIELLQEVDSTNLEARRRIARGCARGFVIAAARQTGGQGRLGRAWESPPGGLWLTIAGRVDGVDELVGLAAARAVARAVQELADDHHIRVKPPNDVLLDGRKVAGILAESITHDGARWAIVGVGVNANFSAGALTPPVGARAVTLLDALGAPVDLEALRLRIAHDVCALLTDSVDQGSRSAR